MYNYLYGRSIFPPGQTQHLKPLHREIERSAFIPITNYIIDQLFFGMSHSLIIVIK